MTALDSLRLVGSVVERKYRVDRAVAEGGFGVVYQGHHLALGVPIALKVLRPSLRVDREVFVDLLSQFRDEANVLTRLRRSSVVAVLDSGVSTLGEEGLELPWMVLEWLEGETLNADLARRRGEGGRTRAECMTLLRPALEAIAEAHELNIAHRDVKPSNIMLVPAKGGLSPRVLDFGIAKMMEPGDAGASAGATATDSNLRAFTAASAAPEQLSGARTGPWTDVYALGLLLTEVLTDRPPIATHDPNERYRIAFAEERPTPASLGVDVGAWEPVLHRALAVRPADRQRDARVLLAELDEALTATAAPAKTAPAPGPRESRSVRRRVAAVAAAAAVSALLLAGVGASRSWQARPAKPSASTSSATPPLVIVSEFRVDGAAETTVKTRRVAAAFAELLAEQLRAGASMLIPAADARAAMLEATGLESNARGATPAQLAQLRATAGADVVVGGEIAGEGGALRVQLDLFDAAHGVALSRVSLAGPASDINALVREAGARVRQELGRPALSAEDLAQVRSSLPESAEAAMVYVEGLSLLRTYRFHDATEHFEEAHRLAPKFVPALAALARARLKLGEQARAREAADRAAELAAELPRGEQLAVVALAAETRHDWGAAVENYRALAQFYPDRSDYVASLARALVGAGKGNDAVVLLESAKKKTQNDWDRMRLDLVASYAYSRQSQDGPSLVAAREAEELASKVGARVPRADAVLEQAHAHHRAGRLEEAEALFTRAREIYVEVKDEDNVLGCDAGLAEIARSRGDVARAIQLGEGIVLAHKKTGNLYRIARETVSLGLVHASIGHLAKARELCDEGGLAYIEAHDREGEAYRLLNLAELDLMLGNLEGVAAGLRGGRALHAEIKHASGVAEADGAAAHLAWYEGRVADAQAAYEVAYTEAAATNESGLLGEIALDRARLAFDRRSPVEGARFEDAEKAVTASSDSRLLALLDVHAARRALAAGDRLEGRRLALSAEERARKAHAIDAVVLALAIGLDAVDEGRDARRVELAAKVEELEALEPKIAALLALGRASRGAEATAFAARARALAKAHRMVVPSRW